MRLAAAALVAMAALPAPGAAAADGIAGAQAEWARDDGQVRARIAPCGAAICATNTWVRNPEGDERVGDKLVMTLTPVDSTHWTGTAFDPKRHLTFSMAMSVAGDRLTTHGCVLAGILCRDVGWTRFSR